MILYLISSTANSDFSITFLTIIILLAGIIGGIIGMCVGFETLPRIIWMLYMMMYQMTPNVVISFNWKYGLLGLILICICIIGATIYSAIRELKETPSALMRPKAPKAGNRVMLERIPFI